MQLPPPPWSSFIPFRDSSRASYGIQPAPGGIGAWFSDRFRGLKTRNNRTAAGAYEGGGATGRGATRHGFGPLDPDDAWDARVGAEADAYYYNEEQELGLHPSGPIQQQHTSSRLNVSNTDTAYLGGGAFGGSSYDMNVPVDAGAHEEPRGRSRDRSPNTNTGGGLNPFDDDAAAPSNLSMRGVSPRPISGTGPSARDGGKADSPTERRSMFRESV